MVYYTNYACFKVVQAITEAVAREGPPQLRLSGLSKGFRKSMHYVFHWRCFSNAYLLPHHVYVSFFDFFYVFIGYQTIAALRYASATRDKARIISMGWLATLQVINSPETPFAVAAVARVFCVSSSVNGQRRIFRLMSHTRLLSSLSASDLGRFPMQPYPTDQHPWQPRADAFC